MGRRETHWLEKQNSKMYHSQGVMTQIKNE